MEVLATIFVTLVILTNSIFPQANLPQVLGVNVGQDEAGKTATDSSPVSERSKEELKNRMDALGELRKDRYLEMLETRKEATEQAKLAREKALAKVKSSREQFKEELKELRDQKKAGVVANIDEIIVNRNEKWVNHWNRVLDRLALILAKIETRRDNLAPLGKDVTAVSAAIDKANMAIDDAQKAVDGQAAKTYIISLESEINLGSSVRSVVAQFKQDVSSVIVEVKTARLVVRDAFDALELIPTPTPMVTETLMIPTQ